MEYCCKTCRKVYREKFNYDRHISTCEFLHKSRRERNNEIELESDTIPDPAEMFHLIQSLVLRIDKLEKENKNIRQIQNRKIDLLDYLNQQQQAMNEMETFDQWINHQIIPLVREHLEIVYQKDLLTATNDMFDKAMVNNRDHIPIRAFERKPNTFYILEMDTETNQKKWTKISNLDFDKYLIKIDRRFEYDFGIEWCLVNREKIETDEKMMDMYVHYHSNILGGNRMSDTGRFERIRKHIYNEIKQGFRATELEIE